MSKVKAKVKSILSLVLALAIALSSFAAIPATEASAADTVTVNLNKTYQTIRGFGGINLPEWAGSDMTTAQVNRAFGNGTYDLGLSILRIYVSDDRNQWYNALATAKTAIANGAIVFATPWNPPASMCETFTRTYTEWDGQVKQQYNQKRLCKDKYADYAQHLNDFVSYMKNNGVDLYAISMANEPDYGHEWTWWTSDECATFLANYAGKINCRVISPESFSYNKEYYNAILNNSAAYNNTDIFGTHFYGTSRSNMDFPALENCGKEIWMTEVYVPNSDADSANRWPEAIQVAENIHNGLVVGNMNAYVWWYIRRSYGPMTEDGNISKRGYCMAQYSKFVRPGDVRVDATEIPTSGVYVSAYKGNDGQAVIVAVNTSSTGYAQNFTLSGNTINKVDRYRTSSSENLALTSNLECSSTGFWATLPANSVSTFVVTLGSGSNTGSNNNTNSGSVSTSENTVQCENMTFSGTYAGKISSPFSGAVLYANNDAVSFNKYFAYDTHDFTLRGASNGSNTAKVDLVINNEKKGTFTFSGTTATEYTLKGITHPTGDINIKLVVSTDDGTWDAYLDYLTVGSASSSSSSNNNSNTNTSTTSGLEGVYFIKNVHSGKYLDVTYGSADNGTNIQQWEGNNAAAQKFKLVSAGNGYYYLYTGASGYSKVVDVEGNKTANGTNILQYSFNGANNQQFKLQQQSDGSYAILTRISGDKSGLDVYEWSSENGGNVNQWEFWGGACQKWILEKTN